ncbi:MAG: hypothetical protein LBS72_01010 [Oscillospiraceae bacterium]|nr:hypothetical protein [Oscillospiraceae bacterium]
MPSPFDLIQQARHKYGKQEGAPRTEQWISMQAGATERMQAAPQSEPEPSQPAAQQPVAPPLYPQMNPSAYSQPVGAQEPARYVQDNAPYAQSAYGREPSAYAQPYQQPYPPQYEQAPIPEPTRSMQPQRVTWTKPGAEKSRSSYYPPAGTSIYPPAGASMSAPQPSSPVMPPPSASQGKHVHLDRIHQRHDDALKEAVFQTIQRRKPASRRSEDEESEPDRGGE